MILTSRLKTAIAGALIALFEGLRERIGAYDVLFAYQAFRAPQRGRVPRLAYHVISRGRHAQPRRTAHLDAHGLPRRLT